MAMVVPLLLLLDWWPGEDRKVNKKREKWREMNRTDKNEREICGRQRSVLVVRSILTQGIG